MPRSLVGSGCAAHSTPMTSVVELYEALTSAEDDRARARVIAEAFERLEDRYPHLPELATQGHLRETELRLQKEIEQVRLEIAQVRGEVEKVRGEVEKVRGEVEKVRGETREIEGRLRLELEKVRGEIAEAKAGIIRWTVGWTGGLLLAQAGLILGGLRMLFPAPG